eukprot:1156396-Pleurochrysis_carterae.AAC.2
MPDSAWCVGLAVQGLQQLPGNRNSAIIEEAFVGWRSYRDLTAGGLRIHVDYERGGIGHDLARDD